MYIKNILINFLNKQARKNENFEYIGHTVLLKIDDHLSNTFFFYQTCIQTVSLQPLIAFIDINLYRLPITYAWTSFIDNFFFNFNFR